MATRLSRPEDRSGVRTLDDLLALNGAEFIRVVYLTLLQRDPDPGGFVAYLDKLSSGAAKVQIISEIRDSAEGHMRAVEVPGLDQASLPAPGGSTGVVDASELNGLLALRGTKFVQHAYALLLGRAADPTGLASYCACLERGISESQILAEIALSEEYRRRNRPVQGIEPIVRRYRHLRNPVARSAVRLARRLQAAAVNLAWPEARDGSQQRASADAELVPASGSARRANLARDWLLTLPTLEQRNSRRKT